MRISSSGKAKPVTQEGKNLSNKIASAAISSAVNDMPITNAIFIEVPDRSEEYGGEEWATFLNEAALKLAPKINEIILQQAKKRFFVIDSKLKGSLFISDTGFTFLVDLVDDTTKTIKVEEVSYIDSEAKYEFTGHTDVVSFINFRRTMRPLERTMGPNQ